MQFSSAINPLLPWEGDHTQFCSGGTQVGAPCDNSATAGTDEIQTDCTCDVSCQIYNADLSASTPICNGDQSDITFNFSGGTGPYDVIWTGGTLNNIDDGHVVTVSPTTTTTYSITSATDANGCTATPGGPVTITVINTLNVGNVSGASTVCQGTTQTYSVTPVAGATEYDWIVPNGATITNVPPYGSSITVNWPAGAESGDVCCAAVNACGIGIQKCRTVIFVPLPEAPVTIYGPVEVCRSNSEDFSIDPVPDAVSYQWSVPTGATITSGQGTTNITVNFGPSAQSGNICVRSIAANACGQSTQTCLAISALAQPVTPVFTAGANTTPCIGSTTTYSVTPQASVDDYGWDTQGYGDVINGQGTPSVTITWTQAGTTTLSVTANSTICSNSAIKNLSVTVRPLPEAVAEITGAEETCNGATNTYTATPVAGATSYTWDIPAIAQVIGGITGNTLTLKWLSPGLTTFGVHANNSCGAGEQTFITVVINEPPAQPGAITGPANICAGSQAIYSITDVLNAASYTWTIPAGASMVSGQGTKTLTVNFPGGSSGQVCVSAVNNCGSSTAECKMVNVGAGSALNVGPITGPANFCPTQNTVYSIATVPGATGYNWSIPPGASIVSGQNTTSIALQWGASTGGQVCVSAIGSCGAGTPGCLSVKPLAGSLVYLGADTTVCPGSTITLNAGSGANAYVWSTGATTNTINVATSGTYTVTVVTGAGNTCSIADQIGVTFGAINPPLAVAALIQPAIITNVPVNTLVTWTLAGGCSGGYFISAGTTPGGIDIINNFNTGNSTTWQPNNDLPPGTTIYVTITPFNNAGNGPGSQFSFTTETLTTSTCDPVQDSLELVDFYYTTNGPNWAVSTQTNWLVESIPIYTWNGINTNFDGCVSAIDLADKNITGLLPDFNLPFLMNLDIINSRLQGDIPDFSNTPLLERIYLTDNELDGIIPNFSHIPNLVLLDIDANMFTGPLPIFDQVKKLEYLDVNFNKIDGGIPDFQIPQLEHLDLNTNLFTGVIPNFTGIPNLQFLGLGENKLTGNIPDFGNLPQAQLIFLNQNFLSGKIPALNNMLNKDVLGFDLNKLTFDGLAQHVSYSYSNFSYAPQDAVFHDTLLIRSAGQNLNFSLDFDENISGNEYHWFKDGVYQSAQDQIGDNNLKINNLNAVQHAGVWSVEVRNLGAPDLTLYSRKIILQIDQSVSCPTVNNNGPFCVGDHISVDYSNFQEFSWDSGPNGIQDPNDVTNATLADAGIYNYTAVCFPNGIITGSVNVQVFTPPAVTTSASGTFCPGETVQLSAAGGMMAGWSWSGPNGFVSNAQNPVLNGLTPLMAGDYIVTVTGTGASACTATSMVTVSVNALPAPLVSNTAQACVGGILTLSETSGTGLIWQWTGPGSFSGSGQTVARNNVTAAFAGTYTVTVTNSDGCTATATTSVTIFTSPQISSFTTAGDCGQGNGTTTVNVFSGALPYQFFWNNNL